MSARHAALDARRWARTRKAAFDRDGWRCRRCGKAGRLEGHHDPPLGPDVDPYDVAGVVTLCRDCHVAHHRHENEPPGAADWRAFIAEMLLDSDS